MPRATQQRAEQRQKNKLSAFRHTMDEGKAAMTQLRGKIFPASYLCENDTRYDREDYLLIRGMSPITNLHFLTRVAFLNQLFNSYKIALLFVFVEEKVEFAYTTSATHNEVQLFRNNRQWCFLSYDVMMRTGLFSGRSDAQKSLAWLEQAGLIYREPWADSVHWMSVEYQHPALLFTKRELLTSDINKLQSLTDKLIVDDNERKQRAAIMFDHLLYTKQLTKEEVSKRMTALGLEPGAVLSGDLWAY
jgi:hypothetical protein